MCGRFTQAVAFDVLAERFGIMGEHAKGEEMSAALEVALDTSTRTDGQEGP